VNAAGRMQIEDDVDRLAIMQIKPLGFSLEEMRELLPLLDAGPARLTAFREQAAERVSTLRRELRSAEEFAARLS
jgi:DNA-binding transcriptional MerR regulator